MEIGCIVAGKYRVMKRLGIGGVGTVYLVLNEAVGKKWAMKEILFTDRAVTGLSFYSMKAELEALKRIEHPNLPAIIDVVHEGDGIYLIMEYIEGKSVRELLEEQVDFSQETFYHLAKQLIAAISYLHHCHPPIIHRDIKPGNLMIRPDGSLVLIDFGCADFHRTDFAFRQQCVGTKTYAAPEQFKEDGVTDQRTDVYGFGKTLALLLPELDEVKAKKASRKKKTRDNDAEKTSGGITEKNIQEGTDYKSDWDIRVLESFHKVIAKCTREKPKDRYQSIEEVGQALDAAMNILWKKKDKKKKALFGLCICFTLVCTVICILGSIQERRYQKMIYQALMEEAAETDLTFVKHRCYMEAISMDPSQVEAYEKLLKVYLLDDYLIWEDERDEFLSLIGERRIPSLKTNLDCLKKKRKDYTSFCFQLGAAFFFQYQGLTGKELARTWFDRALETDWYLDKGQRKRAKIYQRICSYYETLDNVPILFSAEQDTEDYKAFLQDLSSLNENELADMGDNKLAACTIYNEICVQIADHAWEFLDIEGVTPFDLGGELDKISLRMPSLLEDCSEDERDQLDYLKTNLANAYSCVTAVAMEKDHTEVSQ